MSNAHTCAPDRPQCLPQMPTAALNERRHKEQPNPLPEVPVRVPYRRIQAQPRARVTAAAPRQWKRQGGSGHDGVCIGDGGGGDGVDGRGINCAPRAQACVSMCSLADGFGEPRCARVGGRGRAYLCARRRSRRSSRSSEPGSEAGTQPEGGQSHALESARPQGSSSSAPFAPTAPRSQSRRLRAHACT